MMDASRPQTSLRDLEDVAYVRFASVYRDFQDVDEFEQELHRIEQSQANTRSVIG